MTTQYTPWRRFLAWVGFITLLLAFPAIVTLVMWANNMVDKDLRAAHASADARQALIEHCKKLSGEPIYDPAYPDLIECDITL